MKQICITIALLAYILIPFDSAFAGGGRSIYGARRLAGPSSNIFGVSRNSSFHAVSPAGRIPRNFLNSNSGQAYGVRRSWGSSIYGPHGLQNNYFGRQTIPQSSGYEIVDSVKETYESVSQDAQEFLTENIPDSVDFGPGFFRF